MNCLYIILAVTLISMFITWLTSPRCPSCGSRRINYYDEDLGHGRCENCGRVFWPGRDVW
jgi:uncharacterized protein with PIN domain